MADLTTRLLEVRDLAMQATPGECRASIDYNNNLAHKVFGLLRSDDFAALIEMVRAVEKEVIVRFNEDGSLDEVIGTGIFHLEQMDNNHWWMQLGPHMVNLSARGKVKAIFGKNEAQGGGKIVPEPRGGDTERQEGR